jgi:hypothetical protein
MTIPVGLPWLRHSRLTRCDEVEELVEGSTLMAELARAVVEWCSDRGGLELEVAFAGWSFGASLRKIGSCDKRGMC